MVCVTLTFFEEAKVRSESTLPATLPESRGRTLCYIAGYIAGLLPECGESNATLPDSGNVAQGSNATLPDSGDVD